MGVFVIVSSAALWHVVMPMFAGSTGYILIERDNDEVDEEVGCDDDEFGAGGCWHYECLGAERYRNSGGLWGRDGAACIWPAQHWRIFGSVLQNSNPYVYRQYHYDHHGYNVGLLEVGPSRCAV